MAIAETDLESVEMDRLWFNEQCHLRGMTFSDAAAYMATDRGYLSRQLDKGQVSLIIGSRVRRFLAEVEPRYQRLSKLRGTPEQQLAQDIAESPRYAQALLAAIQAASIALGAKLDRLTVEKVQALIDEAK